MKRLLAAVVIALLLSGCAGYMAPAEKPSDLTGKTDKAILLIVRDTFFASESVFQNYLDGRLIGDTTGKTWFLTEVSPGPHYIVTVGGKSVIALIDFKPGKIYGLRQTVTMGPWRAHPLSLWPMSYAEVLEVTRDCTYLEFIPGMGGKDMDPASYKGIVDKYNAEMKNNPELYRAQKEYSGF